MFLNSIMEVSYCASSSTRTGAEMKPGYLAMIQTKDQWCSPGMLTRGALQPGRIFGITAGGGGVSLFCLTERAFPKSFLREEHLISH